MLLWLCAVLVLFALTLALIARAAVALLRRFGLDGHVVLVWLGLAEWPALHSGRRACSPAD